MNNIQYESAEEMKKRLYELYNGKIKDIELLKSGLEEMRRDEEMRIESLIVQKENEKNLEVERARKQIEQALEASFENRVQEAAQKIVQNYCQDMFGAIDKIKSALAELENSMLKLIRFQDYEVNNEDYIEPLKYQVNREDFQEEDDFEEFKELIMEQDKKLESIASMINRDMR